MTPGVSGRWGVCALALALAGLVTMRILPVPVWERAEAYLIDAYQRLLLDDAPETRVVVIDIDDASLAEHGAWPWSRAQLSTLVAALFDDGGAAVVGLDLTLPEAADPPGDAALAAMSRERPLVLAQVFDLAGRVPPLVLGRPLGALADIDRPPGFHWTAAHGFIANHAGLSAARCAGHVNYRPDADGQVRHLPPFIRWSGADYPTLSLAMLACAGILAPGGAVLPEAGAGAALRLPGLTLPLSSRGDWRVPWTRRISAYTVIPAAEVLAGRVPAALLRGTLVLVGSSSLGLSDLVGTPVDPSLPGVMVHAAALSWMLDALGAPQAPAWSLWLPWVWLLLSLVLLTFVAGRASAAMALGAFAALTLAWIALAHQVFGPARAELAIPPFTGLALLFALGAPYEWYVQQRLSRRLYRAFSNHLPGQVLQQMLKQNAEVALKPALRDITILFADIRNSTQTAERLQPDALADFTNAILECLTAAIQSTCGTVDKYMGDGVLAFWGAPNVVADHADQALAAALAIHREILNLNAARARAGEAPVVIHVGVNAGQAMVGELGTRLRRSYTALGESVNIAFRLQELARERDVFAMIGQGAQVRAHRHAALLRAVGAVQLRGVSASQQVFELSVPPPAAADAASGAAR